MNITASIVALLASVLPSPAGGESDSGRAVPQKAIAAIGSDSMVRLMMSCSEAYAKQTGNVVEVNGGGTGIGIAALAAGTADLALSTRKIAASEIAAVKKRTGREPVETVVAYEALAIIVPKESKLAAISVEQLREIFAEGGKLEQWEQVEGSGLTGPIKRWYALQTPGTISFSMTPCWVRKGIPNGGN